MILTHGSILFIAIITIILFFIIYLFYRRSYLKWDELKTNQLENFIKNNSILVDDFNFLSERKKECFFKNFIQKISYSDFQNILEIRLKTKKLNDEIKNQYLNNNNDYQTFLIEILKCISDCLSYKDNTEMSNGLRSSQNKVNNIDAKVVYMRLNDKIIGSEKTKKEASEYIAKQLNDKGYTLNELNYLDKFYVDPETNKSSAPVIKDFVDFLTKINKWSK